MTGHPFWFNVFFLWFQTFPTFRVDHDIDKFTGLASIRVHVHLYTGLCLHMA